MRVEGLEKDSLRLREIEKIFLPANIDPNIILQAFKAQQARKIMASSRARQFLPEKKNHEPKLNLLHVAGKELTQSSQDLLQTKKNKRQVHSVRQALQRPLSQIIQKLSQDQQRALFQKQLSELRKYDKDRQARSIFQNASSLKELEVVRPTRYSSMVRSSLSKDEIFCEQIVMKNPILMRKVLMADKEVRRKQLAEESKRLKQSPARHLPQLAKYQLDQESSFALFRQFQTCLNLSNRLIVSPIPEGQYKAFIEPGNNGMLIRSILQSRPWWALRSSSEIQNCNMVWTQWKNTKLINILPIGQNQTVKLVNGTSNGITSINMTRKLPTFIQERHNQVKRLIGQKSQVWKHFQPNGNNYFTFGKKLEHNKFRQFLRRNINQLQYQHITNPKDQKMLNHVPGGLELHSKKHLLKNLRRYVEKKGEDLNNYVPVSYHVKAVYDTEWKVFQSHFLQIAEAKGQNVWICKPGQNSNRGNGIFLSNNLKQMSVLVNQRCQDGRTVVIQKYIEEPFLFKGRKCDLRCFLLITTVGSRVKGYWFEQGYVRTSSRPYNLNHINNKMVHLTNDAVQKKGIEYGRYQQCNKVSFSDFQKYLQQNHPQGPVFPRILQHLKFIAAELVRSVGPRINFKGRNHTFELFGLDYMLDSNMKPYLIEANSNPCLQVAGTVLGRLIPYLIENVLRVAVDPIFPAPENEAQRGRNNLNNPFEANKMELIFDSAVEGFWEASKGEDDVQQGQNKQANI